MVVSYIRGLLGLDDSENGVEALKAALVEPRTNVGLYGVFAEPHLDVQGAKTAVFTVTLYDEETGEEYGETKVEFEIDADAGKERLDEFLSAHGVDELFDLEEIVGANASVERTDSGNIEVQW